MTAVSQSPSVDSLPYDLPPSRRRFSTSPLSASPTTTVPARSGHYRPFSTLYTESPYIDIQDKISSLLKRHSSIGGLQTFAHMGIGFKDKAKANKNLSPVHVQVAEPIGIKICTPTQIPSRQYNALQRPATSSGVTSPAPTLHRVKKKRSTTSPFTATDPSTSSAVSPLSGHHFLSPPQTPNISSSTSKRTRFLDQDHESFKQFIPKSIWAKRHNMKLHPYHRDVPYMQAYDPILLDSDRYSDLLLQRLAQGSPSFHNYGRKPPAMALDLGCGPGHWVLHAAATWKTSQIIGLDIVDLTLPGFETTDNAHFILGNFVAFDLPFPDNSFDYVRMSNLVLCIPYGKWDCIFKEVRRVLAVNGKVELIDDQILFPYGIAPKQPSWSPNMSDAFDDAYFDDDKETLQGSESDTGSTLNANSEPSNSSYEDQIFDSPTLRPIASPTPRRLSPCQSSGSALDAESRYISWHNQATASRELESIFEIMLQQRYKIIPRPSDFILNRMKSVFGSEAAGKTKSFHIKLAPIDSADAGSGQGKADGEETKGEKTVKKKEKRKLKKANNDNFKANTTASSGTSSERSSLENSTSVSCPSSTCPSPVPASTDTKATGRLGISFGSSSKETASISPPPLQPDQTQAHILSAKAAGRLGISYSDLAAATVASTHQQAGASASPSSPLQSPGLLVWPSTFIPLTPVEVEMHANKYVHTLLGCKPALAEFIAQFTDEDGTRFVDDDEFHEVMWKYECFRRSRFNWPSDISDPYDEEPTVVSSPVYAPPLLKSKSGSQSSKNSSDSSYGGELTHIRTIRVFEATKVDGQSFASLLFYQKMPPMS